MVEIKITVKSVQTTDEGTLVIEMSPYPYARWIQTEALADANVAVQPYGVIMVPEAATFTPGGLTVDVEVKGYIFSVLLASLMEADAEDQIEFISPYITVADLADVDLTNLQNGQTLLWDATNNVWVNGAGGGGGGETGYTITKNTLADETITLTGDAEEGYYGTFTTPITFVEGDSYLVTIGNETAILKCGASGLMFSEASGSYWISIYDDDGTITYEGSYGGATLHIKIEHIAITLTDDFVEAVNAATPLILEADENSQALGTPTDPRPLIGFDAISATHCVGKQVIIHDNYWSGYYYPSWFSGVDETTSVVFEVVHYDGGSIITRYYGFTSPK